MQLMKLVIHNKVNSLEWLLLTGYCERQDPSSVIEDIDLYGLGVWDTCRYVELYDRPLGCKEYCVARCTITGDGIYGLVVYPMFRGRGYAEKMVQWILDNTICYTSTSSNPIIEKVFLKLGMVFNGKITKNEYGSISNKHYEYKRNKVACESMTYEELIEYLRTFIPKEALL